jgi:hypothetical protein
MSSQVAYLVRLLHENGFDVAALESTGPEYSERIRLTVYPRKTEATKDEGTQGS